MRKKEDVLEICRLYHAKLYLVTNKAEFVDLAFNSSDLNAEIKEKDQPSDSKITHYCRKLSANGDEGEGVHR
jgi:hypothetical protein